jgi:DnaJ family protein C protein 3
MGGFFLATFEGAVVPDAAPSVNVTIPPPKKASPRRAVILRALCRAHVQLRQARAGEQWCDELLRMVGNEKDIDALLGKGEALRAREEWEEAVDTFERAWEASGGGNREVCILSFLHGQELILESKLEQMKRLTFPTMMKPDASSSIASKIGCSWKVSKYLNVHAAGS